MNVDSRARGLPRSVVARRLAELVMAGEALPDRAELLVVGAVAGEGASTMAVLLAEGLERMGRHAIMVKGVGVPVPGALVVRDGGAVLTPGEDDPLVHAPKAARILLVTRAGATPGGVVQRAFEELARRATVPVELVLNDVDNPTVRGELAALLARVGGWNLLGWKPLGGLAESIGGRWVLVR